MSAPHLHDAGAPATAGSRSSLFRAGVNCWRIEQAERAALLIDGEEYFRAFAAATLRARDSIMILAWDFNSRTCLHCSDVASGAPELLGDYLNFLARRRHGPEVRILIWDYPMVFGTDREFPSVYGLGWKPARNVHVRYDNTHPVTGSHHQKIVVVDDAVAFCGGLDLTCRRWDTGAHRPGENRRCNDGTPYPPFHDVMMMVDGSAARALGELARERWLRATGRRIASTAPPPPAASPSGAGAGVGMGVGVGAKAKAKASARAGSALRNGVARHLRLGRAYHADRWPAHVQPDLRRVDVAISRTQPGNDVQQPLREVERLYLDMIAAARRYLYIENQYFTSHRVGEALQARLAEPEGPEVIVVLRLLSHGWLEELTMQNLRKALIARLREADVHHRLHVCYPHIEGLAEGTCIDVHSKVMIVDDQWARVGSANVSNRSMGFDTECDLTLDAGGRADLVQGIAAFRDRLLGEHLGVEPQRVAQEIERRGSLGATIGALGSPGRALKRLDHEPEVSGAVMTIAGLADPEQAVKLETLVGQFAPRSEVRRTGVAWIKLASVVLLIAGLTALWRFTPLADYITADRITGWAQRFASAPWAPFALMGAYIPAALILFPRPLLTLFAVVAFGPWLGFGYAMSGILLSAYLTYVAGMKVDRSFVRRISGPQLDRIIQVLRQRGLVAMTALRLVPLAPFAVEGVIAGAIRIRLRDFLGGTGLGMLPGTLAATVFGDQLQAGLRDPEQVNYWLIAGVVLLLVVAALVVRRWLLTTELRAQAPSQR